MRTTFLCLFALQLAFAVMATPRARAQDEESAGGDVEITTTPAGGDEEAKPEGDGDATDPPAEAVREAQDNDAMRAVDEAARNMDRDRNVAKQKLNEIGSAIDQELQDFDEKANSRSSYRV